MDSVASVHHSNQIEMFLFHKKEEFMMEEKPSFQEKSKKKKRRHRTCVKYAKMFIYVNNKLLALAGFILVGVIAFIYLKFEWISLMQLVWRCLIVVAALGLSLSVVVIFKLFFISRQKACPFLFFSIVSIVIVLMLIGAGFYASVNKEIVEDFIDVLDKVYNDEKSFKDMWETVEKKLNCSGVKRISPYKNPCADALGSAFHEHIAIFQYVGVAFGVIQIIDIVLSVYLFKQFRKP